jgi:hypothetical protein
MSTPGEFSPLALDAAANAAALAASSAPQSQTGILIHTTAARTADLQDAVVYVRFTSPIPVTYTIPADADEAFPINSVIEFEQADAGVITVFPAADVVINSRGGVMTTAGQFAVAALRKTGVNEWTLTGDVA